MIAVVALFAVGGVLLGGAWSLREQSRPWPAVAVVGLLGLGCAAAGALYLF